MTRDITRQPPRLQKTLAASQSRRTSLFVIIGLCFLLAGCTPVTPKQRVAEAPPPTPVAPVESSQPQQAQALPPPELNKVEEAVRRVFKDKALIDTARKPSFVAGDFNGDLSQDIAVVLKPASGKLPEINEEFPPWILKDPFTSNEPGKRPLSVTEDEPLLAVIHGFGPNGWTDPQATQTFLLKNAVGSAMQARSAKEFLAANRGKNLPGIRGDLIGEVLKGTQGYLYYGTASYSWYDPKTYKGESRPGAFHSAGSSMKK
jgi:hypothetical protein